MKKLNDLEYLKLNKLQAFLYDTGRFFSSIPAWFVKLGISILTFFKNVVLGIKDGFVDIVTTFTKGNWAVKLSFVIFGFGNLYYGQIMRGILFLLFEIAFIVYMFVLPEGGWYDLKISHFLQAGKTVGEKGPIWGPDPNSQLPDFLRPIIKIPGDDSSRVLLWALIAIIFIIAFIYTWRMQVKQCRICMDITASGKKIKSGKDDLKSLLDDQFHKTLLAPSVIGITVFTILPTIFMMLIAFTNFTAKNDGLEHLFSWVGFENFSDLMNFGNGGFGTAFKGVLGWNLTWAFFATFSNYFLGMLVAMMINKKGIKIKKFWRTVLVMTIAIPQFVSLLYVSRLFASDGIIGRLLLQWDLIPQSMLDVFQRDLWANPTTSKILLIIINIWVGIPYVMLMATGILMNIPADLYESAKIDGASGYQQFTKITLPYMLFVTGPYLLTSFVGNLNNFNIIYLLSGGGPVNHALGSPGGVDIGHTDLLITWMFKITAESDAREYNMASVIGILMFLVVSILSLIVYNIIPSTKNEEDFG